MKKSTRAVLWSFVLLGLLAYAAAGVLVISRGPAQVDWVFVTLLLGAATVNTMYVAWLTVFKIVEILRAPADGPFGRVAPLDKYWGREKD